MSNWVTNSGDKGTVSVSIALSSCRFVCVASGMGVLMQLVLMIMPKALEPLIYAGLWRRNRPHVTFSRTLGGSCSLDIGLFYHAARLLASFVTVWRPGVLFYHHPSLSKYVDCGIIGSTSDSAIPSFATLRFIKGKDRTVMLFHQ